jgi:pimeloyl-ACP methyl ester carboxylesterase
VRQLDLGPARAASFATGSFTTGGGVIAALCAGPEEGPPALLVPGFTGSKEDFGPLFAPLAAAGMRVVAIDLPGQFESAPPSDPDGYAPSALSAGVRAVAAQLGPSVHLLGHSFGGLVCRAAVLHAPSGFASLVLMDSGPAALGGARRERIERLRPHLPALGVAGVYEATEQAAATEPGYVAPPPELAAFLRTRFLAGTEAMLRGMGDALLAEPDRVAELAATGVRTLVLYGEDDDAWPPEVQRAMAQRLGADVVAVPRAAHSPAVENPAPTASALLEFWRR